MSRLCGEAKVLWAIKGCRVSRNPTPNERMQINAILDYTVDRVMTNPNAQRDMKIFKRRFGIGYSSAMTLKGTGRLFHISPERVRQIEAKLLHKLRKSHRLKMLADIYCEK